MKFYKSLKYVFTAFVCTWISCENPCNKPFSKVSHNYLIFIDESSARDDNDMAVLFSRIDDAIKDKLSLDSIIALNFSIKMINDATQNTQTLVSYDVGYEYNKACQYQNPSSYLSNDLEDKFNENLEEIPNNSGNGMKVLATLNLIKEELASIDSEETLSVLFISDMIEISGIEGEEDNGFFNFVKKGDDDRYYINSTHVNSATRKIADGLLEAYNSPIDSVNSLSKNTITVFRPLKTVAQSESGTLGGSYSDIQAFWRLVFQKKGGTNIVFKEIDDLKFE